MNDEETQRDIAEELKRGIWEHRKKEIEFTIYRIRKSPLSIIGIILISIFIIIALAAPLICPPNQPDPYRVPKTTSRLPLPPSREHPFGTAGPLTYIDIFYGVIWGTRLSLMLAFTITGVCFIIGLFIGTISGYFGGRVDEILMRITDLAYALPWLLIMLVVLVAIGKPGFWTMVIAYTSVAWSNYARVVRGEVLKIKNELYIEAAKAIGLSDFRIIIRHVIPNVIYSVLVMASLRMGWIVLTTSSLGFLGLGFRRGTAEWGIIISEGRDWILQGSWWITVYPGLFIFFFVLGWQLLGDAFRDILDPKVRRGL